MATIHVTRRAFDVALLALIVGVALLVRTYFFVGVHLNDDIAYVNAAYRLSQGDVGVLATDNIHEIRSMSVIPIAVTFRLFGVGEGSAALYPLLCSLGLVVLAVRFGCLFFDATTGYIAGLLYAFFPLDIIYASQVGSDVPLAFLLGLSLYLFADNQESDKRYAAAGIIGGLAYLAKSMGVLVVPFAAAFVLICPQRHTKRGLAVFAAGFILVMALEATFMYAETGDPLWRLGVIHSANRELGTNVDTDYYPRTLLTIRDVNHFNHEGSTGLYAWAFLGALGCLLAAGTGRRRVGCLTVWAVGGFLYLQYGIMSLDFTPTPKWVRFLEVVAVPAIVLIAAGLARLWRSHYRIVAALMIIVLVGNALVNTTGMWEAYRIQTDDFRLIAEALEHRHPRIVYTDLGTAGFIRFYLGYTADIRLLEKTQPNAIHHAYVVLYGNRGVVENQRMKRELAPYAGELPEQWRLIETIEGSKTGIWGRYNPRIYYAP